MEAEWVMIGLACRALGPRVHGEVRSIFSVVKHVGKRETLSSDNDLSTLWQ